MAIATLLTYAAAFTIGIRFYDRFENRSNDVPKASSTRDPQGNIIKSVMLVFAILVANEGANRNALADPVVYSSVFPWPKNLEYIVLAGRESHPGSGGYHTVHIKVVPTRAAYTREHRLTFTISTHHDYQRTLAAATTSKLTLPQSGSEVHHHVLVPNFGSESHVRLEIREDGRSVLDEPWVMSQTFSFVQGHRTTIGILDPQSVGAGTSFPDLRSIVTIFGSPAPISEDASELRLSDADARARASGTQNATVQFRVIEPLPNPANWLSLSDLDVIVVPNEFWTNLSVSSLSHDAMRRWVAAGGVLWSYGDTSMASQQQKVFIDSLQFEKVATASVPSGRTLRDSLQLKEINDSTTLTVQPNGFAYRRNQGSNSSNRTRQEVLDALASANNPIAKIENQQDVASRIQIAEYGLGRVVRLMSPDPFPESLQFWRAVKSVSLDDPVWTAWGDRFGLSYENGSNNYWRWLISEVGGPPVKSFLMLNTLFVVIVGPVACLVLRRHSKLYMLYFLGPAMAILVSVRPEIARGCEFSGFCAHRVC